MPERKTCTFCGQDGHRASQCRQRRAALPATPATNPLAAVVRPIISLVRWLHQHPDTLTTVPALIAGAAALYLIVTGA